MCMGSGLPALVSACRRPVASDSQKAADRFEPQCVRLSLDGATMRWYFWGAAVDVTRRLAPRPLPVRPRQGPRRVFRPERTCVPPSTSTATPPLRLVVAEDETLIRLDLQTLLERAGHQVVGAAKDGEEAIALAAEHEPDLVLLDVRMPRLGGIEAARRIVAARPVPVVMLSAYGQQEHVRAAAGAGSFGYVVKPFREEDVTAAITTAQERFRELAAARAEAAALAEALDERAVVR